MKLPDGANLDRTEEVVREVGDIAKQHPAVAGAVGFPGLINLWLYQRLERRNRFPPLKPFEERLSPDMYSEVVAGQLQGQLFGIDDALVFCVNAPPILGLGNTGGFKLFLQDKGNLGQEALFNAAQAVLAAVRQDPTFTPLSFTSATLGVPRVAVDIDRERVLAQGLSLNSVYEALQGYFGQRYVNDFNAFGRTYQVHLQAESWRPRRARRFTTPQNQSSRRIVGPDRFRTSPCGRRPVRK